MHEHADDIASDSCSHGPKGCRQAFHSHAHDSMHQYRPLGMYHAASSGPDSQSENLQALDITSSDFLGLP